MHFCQFSAAHAQKGPESIQLQVKFLTQNLFPSQLRILVAVTARFMCVLSKKRLL